MLKQTELTFPDRERGFVCQYCGSYCKLYKRSFNSNMALALTVLYKSNGFVHLEDEMAKRGFKRCGDASYLFWYGFVEKLPLKREDTSRRNGYYKITGRGMMFVEGKITAHAKFLMYNNKCEGFGGKDITIQDALGTKFNYQTLMNGEIETNR